MWDELENSLAWFSAAPARWVNSAKQDLSAAAQWIWEVIQGDFNEEQTTAQAVTGTVISMIPFVDQVCDVRDIVANCRKINEDSSNKWAWIALLLTLIGLFPTLGSLVKGCFKILFAYGRKAMFRAGGNALQSGMWQATKPWVEAGITKLNQFMLRPEARRAMAALKWDNPYKELARLLRKLIGEINVSSLMKVFDEAYGVLKSLIELVQKWGSKAMATQAGDLLRMVKRVRDQANAKLGEVLAPAQDWLNRLARRLEIEADMNYRAYTDLHTPHAFKKPNLDAEIAKIKADRPNWVDELVKPKYPARRGAPPIPAGWPDVTDTGPKVTRKKYDTFHGDMNAIEIAPGTTIYRVLDPTSSDNSICWMTKAEFDKLKSKDDWRRRFAVWANWNSNGEFVTYTVPAGKPLKVWEGITGSQVLKDSYAGGAKAVDAGGGKKFILEGGARQLVLNPADLEKVHLGKRQATGWGYNAFDESVSLIGVPVLKNSWYEPK